MKAKPLISPIDNLSIRPSGSWVHKKHFYLKRYADILTRAMAKKWPLTYVDLFAGPGRCMLQDGSEVDGSPLIALNYAFHSYIFVEKSDEDIRALKQRCLRSPKLGKISFIEGDCNEVISKVVPEGLGFAFIDPTDIDVHFETIRSLTNSRRIDLLMNIQFGMDIKRNFRLYSEKGSGSKLDLFLGGGADWKKVKAPLDVIKLYTECIRQLGYTTVEYDRRVVENQKNVPMYFLLFASKNPKGLEFWRKIITKDETGQYELSF